MTRRVIRMTGFTLLEVMVALLVIAIGLGAVIDSTTNSTAHAAHLKQKTIAGWVAQNELALFRAKRSWSTRTNRQGKVEMANTTWQWKMEVKKTDEPSLRLVVITVYLDGSDNPVTSLTGFIGRI